MGHARQRARADGRADVLGRPTGRGVHTTGGRGLAAERNEQPYGTILTIDKERAEARRKRLTEAQPTIPDGLIVLMLGIACVAIFAIGTFTLPNVSRRVQIGVLAALIVVLGALLLTIRDLDRKYDGWSSVEPSDMRLVEGRVSDAFARRYPAAPLPCDASGAEH